tara:strand:+ start:159 stop:533 length:375 start_codon:yes stop_codon:yes gene_type:complete
MPRKRKSQPVLVLTKEVPLLLTDELPVNNHMKSAIVALCLAMVVVLLVNIRLEFERQRIGMIDGEPVYRYTWIRPWNTEPDPFLMPRIKPRGDYNEHYEVEPDRNSKQFLTVWRIIRFGMQIYN